MKIYIVIISIFFTAVNILSIGAQEHLISSIVTAIYACASIYIAWDCGMDHGKYLQEKENQIINSIGEDL